MEKERTEGLMWGTELSADTKKEYGEHVISVLNAVHNVRELTLSPWLLEVVPSPPVAQLERVSLQFINLRNLKLKTWLCDDSIHAITYLLNISSNVETLIVELKLRDICINDGLMAIRYPRIRMHKCDDLSGNFAEECFGVGENGFHL
ncbi:hypothetical protein FRX31_010006 [Thalictrum thalictroides]|uniref:Uncharacterized protein n=1 Tax=Thalictrum thalictroides TaxID=46969 RepID=A0A7J6WSP9_THATH|nr:hypothetical protein FRX31_010006 [Thalictrum thalictroides]